MSSYEEFRGGDRSQGKHRYHLGRSQTVPFITAFVGKRPCRPSWRTLTEDWLFHEDPTRQTPSPVRAGVSGLGRGDQVGDTLPRGGQVPFAGHGWGARVGVPNTEHLEALAPGSGLNPHPVLGCQGESFSRLFSLEVARGLDPLNTIRRVRGAAD
jgi:hypothetical protein